MRFSAHSSCWRRHAVRPDLRPPLAPDGTHDRVRGPDHRGQDHTLRPSPGRVARPADGWHRGRGRPFWSPDGRTIGYSTGSALAIVPAAGGVPEKVADVIRAATTSWSARGVFLISRGTRMPLARFSLADRKITPATTLGSDDVAASCAPVPSGRAALPLSRPAPGPGLAETRKRGLRRRPRLARSQGPLPGRVECRLRSAGIPPLPAGGESRRTQVRCVEPRRGGGCRRGRARHRVDSRFPHGAFHRVG